MESQVKTYTYPNGDIQRVQLLRWDSWEALDFLSPTPSAGALRRFSGIYRDFLVPAAPFLFGNMVMFRLPENCEATFPLETKKYGTLSDPLTAAAVALKEGVRIVRGKPRFKNPQVRKFWQQLEAQDCLRIVSGKLPVTTIIPLQDTAGYLTESAIDAPAKVNASFFIMDKFDCATVYDHLGEPFGLTVKDGIVTRPPLYHREALLVKKDGTVSVQNLDIRGLSIRIGEKIYIHGRNADIYTRPRHPFSPAGKKALVMVGTKVVAVRKGSAPIPASGFVLCPREECNVRAGDTVTYQGLEDVTFGIQVGNSILRDGEKTDHFRSRFYNIRHLEPVPYPPSLYPMDFAKARAARIALGADAEGRPMLLWAEGAAKFGYVPGQGSCGASQTELVDICADVGMFNAVNLDGGGSAQMLLKNQRSLQISDRHASDFSEAERPVPLGLVIREQNI